jgi:hypothetical protein
MKLLSVDPGVQWAGVAVFDLPTKQLLAAKRFRGGGFRNNPWALVELAREIADWAAIFGTFGAAAMEWPQVYAGRQRGRKDPNDLLPLAGLDAAVLGELAGYMAQGADAKLYRPHDWKGSKQANPTARLVIERLTPEERRQVEDFEPFLAALEHAEAESIKQGKVVDVDHPAHNTTDGIGVGLKYLGRLERQRVIRR